MRALVSELGCPVDIQDYVSWSNSVAGQFPNLDLLVPSSIQYT